MKKILYGLAVLFVASAAIAQFRIVTGSDTANEQFDDVIGWQATSSGTETLYQCNSTAAEKALTIVDLSGLAGHQSYYHCAVHR